MEKKCSSASFLFIREVNTKSSFALKLPLAWFLRDTICEGDGDLREAEACISSNNTHTSNESSGTTTIDESLHSETFLFGGFELVTNVKTVKVYAIRSIDSTITPALESAEETYLTTCKGLPMRDLPALSITPYCIDGKNTIATTASNVENGDDGEGTNETTEPEDELYYKFIFVLPGGPKPIERVRLKFIAEPIHNNDVTVPSSIEKHHGSLITIRTLKVKGRLSDTMPPTKAKPTPSIAIASGSEGTNCNNINDYAASSGNESIHQHQRHICQMIPQEVRQMIPPSSSSTSTPRDYSLSMNQQQQQQQHHNINNYGQERNQAEIMSTMAGLGMFIRNMETRIMKRLDDVVARIDELDMTNKHSTNT